ncbi:MAG: TonB-dependent receptor, partial [Flavobacteriales bacterium]|nr:TonB-dependent receptor [Flavobacteriales bacterium]
YEDLNGGILEACGIMFSRDLKVYLYPYQESESSQITNSDNLEVNPFIKPLFEYFKMNRKIIDLNGYNPEVLNIFSQTVLKMIKNGEANWEEMVPSYVDNIIKDKKLFGYKPVDQKEKVKV